MQELNTALLSKIASFTQYGGIIQSRFEASLLFEVQYKNDSQEWLKVPLSIHAKGSAADLLRWKVLISSAKSLICHEDWDAIKKYGHNEKETMKLDYSNF